ncbi:MAG: pyruvate, water dikinase [Desulfobacteraceae bacterium]|jgi:pyruvate,water dikinase|nr:MAG: pyruvate, water dikinase [Desulfobacteraceae bacterium]
MGLIHKLRKAISAGRKKAAPVDAEELRIAFRARYHQFKLLLNANNRALEIMAEMEEALKGTWPFGMHFVRARCTAVAASVFQIVKHINELAPGPYEALYERFKEIQKKINPYLSSARHTLEGPLVISLDKVDRNLADLVGGKMANLGEMKNRLFLNVPEGFIITAQAYFRFMEAGGLQSEVDRMIQATDASRLDELFALSAALQQLIIRSPLPEELEQAIEEHYSILEKNVKANVAVAMRSSALGEDAAGASFAGQYRSILNVRRETLFQAYREIVASKYGLTAMSYRLNRGIRDEDVAMCVGCLAMVDAQAGGVVYSRNPVRPGDDAIVINSVLGLPKSVVDGSSAVDVFTVSRGKDPPEIEKEIAIKVNKFLCYPDEGICRIELTEEEGEKPSLTDEQATEIALIAGRLEEYYGTAQDVEWALDNEGAIVFLQSRPLQQRSDEEAKAPPEIDRDAKDSALITGGITASGGTGVGTVFVVRKDMDALSFPEGGVLVTEQSLPRWAPLLSRAAAVVTEQGSLAGHLGNVAREFGVPALFGVKGAVENLKDLKEITVDADSRVIYRGRIDSIAKAPAKKKGLMEGSPVLETLKGASRHIIPLNLLDPDSPNFVPSRCMTFHDITRFCHEKSVHEMFEFGKRHHFPERSSKQLLCDVPMQWWILNLDDGYREEVEGRYVRIDNIVSIPMRAIWEGISAFPWEGPPPVDGKGLMSIMFEATANTSLVPGVRSSYGNRNYFMISKNYCSLTSRLGFHFSTIETLVSERSSENYISFVFKGGAADYERRLKRVLFVGDILEEFGFRISVKEDTLMARMEDRDLEYMTGRLKVLGYLTIHTRQLDMIMLRSKSVDQYRAKMNDHFKKLLAPLKQ